MRALLALLVILALLVAGGAYFAITTTAGARLLLDVASQRVPGELSVRALDGSVLGGLTAGQVEYRQDALDLRLADVEFDLALSRLLYGEGTLERLAAASIVLNDLPADVAFEAHGRVRLGGNWPFEGTVSWNEHISGVRGSGPITGTPQRVTVQQSIALPDPVHIDAVVDLAAAQPAVAGTVRFDAVELPLEEAGPLVAHDGLFEFHASPSGYSVDGDTRLVRDGVGELLARIRAQGTPERVTIESLQLEGLGGHFSATGTVAPEGPAVDLQLVGRDFDPGVLFDGFDGRLSFDARAEVDWPGAARLVLTHLEGEFLGAPVRGAGEAAIANGALRSARGEITSGANRLQVEVSGGAALAGKFSIDAPRLESLWPGLGGSLHGTGQLAGTRAAPDITADLAGTDIVYGGFGAGRLQVDAQASERIGLALDLRAEALRVNDQSLGTLTVQGSGTLDAHDVVTELAGGIVGGRVVARGSWDGDTLHERIPSAVVESGMGDWSLERPTDIEWSARGLHVAAHCWTAAPAQLCVDDIRSGAGKLSAGATLSRFPLASLEPWLGDEVSLSGEANARIGLERGDDGFAVSVDWRQQDTQIVYGQPEAADAADEIVVTRLEDVSVRLRADESRAAVLAVITGDYGLRIDAQATLETPFAADGTLSGQLRANIPDIGELQPLTDRYLQTRDMTGKVVVDVALAGTRAAPSLDGTARLTDGAASVPATGIDIEDAELSVRGGDDGRLRLEGSARSGDGHVALDGDIGLLADSGWFAKVAVTGERFQLIRLPDLSAEVSPDVRLRLDATQIEVEGRILVPEAAVTLRDLGAETVALSDDVVVHSDSARTNSESPGSRLSGQVEFVLGDAVSFEGLGIETRLTGALQLVFRPGLSPTAEGSLQLADGHYDAFGRGMQIERGSLSFVGPLDDPYLQARASRRQKYQGRDIKVGVDLSGRLSEQLSFTLFSDPPMSQNDILSYIVAGRPAADGDDAKSAISSAAFAMGLQSMTATSRIGDTLNLDEVRFESGDDDTSVVAGKQIGADWYVRYTYGLFSRIGTFYIRYDVGRGVSIEAGSGEQQTLELIYSVDR